MWVARLGKQQWGNTKQYTHQLTHRADGPALLTADIEPTDSKASGENTANAAVRQSDPGDNQSNDKGGRSPKKQTGGTQRGLTPRKRLLVLLICIFLVIDIVLLASAFAFGGLRNRVAVTPNLNTVIVAQTTNSPNLLISNIGYDPALDLATLRPYIKSVDTRALMPLKNNYLATVQNGSTQQTVLVDSTTVGRVISTYSNLVRYCNYGQADALANDLLDNSQAAQLLKAPFNSERITFHRLAIGRIYCINKPLQPIEVYIFVQPYYTQVNNDSGQAKSVGDVYLFKLVPKGSTLVVEAIEQVVLPAAG